MGTKMSPKYANLFSGCVKKQIFEQDTGLIPDYLDHDIDDCLGAASCSRVDRYNSSLTKKSFPTLDFFDFAAFVMKT